MDIQGLYRNTATCTLLFFKEWSFGLQTYVYTCMDSPMTTKIFEIDGLPNFLRCAAPLELELC